MGLSIPGFRKSNGGVDPEIRPSRKPALGWSLTVHFDEDNPNVDAATGQRKSLSHLDYSPLPRITRQSFFMGVLISMGGFLYVLKSHTQSEFN